VVESILLHVIIVILFVKLDSILFSHIELGKHILVSSEKCEVRSTNNKLIYSIVLLICLQKRTSNHLSGPERNRR